MTVWRRLREMLAGWRTPKRQISLELTPEEQIAVRFLTQFGRGTDEDIYEEVRARRWIEPHMIVTALFNLQLKGLVQLAERSPATGAVYVPTARAFKVRELLPQDPVSSMQIYLTVAVAPPTRQNPS